MKKIETAPIRPTEWREGRNLCSPRLHQPAWLLLAVYVSVSKYACAYITYTIYSSSGQNYYRVDVRYFKGATDGGAQQWQIQYYNDYRWNGSAWVLSYGSGSTGWWTNSYMPGSYSSVGPPNAQTVGAMSQVNFRYFEVTPDYPNGYYWTWGPFNFYVT